jgi:hypothetical protein
MSYKWAPAELAQLDQEVAKGEELLAQMVKAYRDCLNHEGGGHIHALEEACIELFQCPPATLASLLICAIRRRALDEEARNAPGA